MRQDELRPALYHRLHLLMPLLSHSATGRIWRLLVRVFWLAYFAFVLLILALRYLILPNIEAYRVDIEEQVSQAIGLSVSVGQIAASWDGIHPDLLLSDVIIADSKGQPALALPRIHGVLSWSSLPRLALRLRLLQIDEPTLHLRRDSDGRFFVAGIALADAGGDNAVGDWILAQKEIRVRGATVAWEDAKREAPPLILEAVNFALDNDAHHHRFALTALPPPALAAAIDLRGDFRGQHLGELEAWNGQAFVQIDYADLAVWRTWIDYPIVLQHGRGAMRAWVGFTAGKLDALTADLALDDVNLRLANDLPALELEQLSGRISARLSATGMSVDGSRVELLTEERKGKGARADEFIRLAPTDFHVDWQRAPDGGALRGRLTASVLELTALASLARYLPLDAGSRQLLADYAPRGRVSQLRAAWVGDAERLHSYSLKAHFDALAVRAKDSFPGVSGLSGVVDANERGGSATLGSGNAEIDLPSVLPDSSMRLGKLNAQARWKINQGVLEAELLRAEFSGPDATGSAKGTYRYRGDGPGSIDLSAALTRADARAVWRYLPLVLNRDARHWVRDALKAGSASEAKLVLKGNLANFPFVDHTQGQFLVTVKAQGVTLDYGNGWPEITGLDADLRFAGNGMLVDVRRGAILGASLAQTRAEIPDFDAPVSTLKVQGRAEGDTAQFLKFIVDSPVAERIDHFSDAMRASGKGRLDIGLVIPLEEARLGESKIDAEYVFLGNEVSVDPALPPLHEVNGRLQFTAHDLRIPEIKAKLAGGPVKIKGGADNGKVRVDVDGSVDVNGLRGLASWPLLAQLSGSAAYNAQIQVRKRNVELVLESDLLDIASTLPAPFAKSRGEPMRLHLDNSVLPPVQAGKALPIVREQLRVALGSVLNLHLIHRQQDGRHSLERAAIAIGRPMKVLPERGINVGISTQLLDIDTWRKVLAGPGKDTPVVEPGAGVDAASEGASAGGLPVLVELKAGQVVVSGWRYSDVTLALSGEHPRWVASLLSREATGALQWDGAGTGKLSARLKKWQLPGKDERSIEPVQSGDALQKLPALDIVVDEFEVGVRRFGRLDVQAHNDGGIWRLDRVELLNPVAKFSASGQWQVANGNRTQLDFALDSSDVGKLLDRLGYPGSVRAGSTRMKGKLGWNGPPEGLDYATLNGDLQLEARKGEFLKLDPGAAGKLLGLISLQGLPRRFTLDFGDVFSEGFAFDTISGRMTVKDGVMSTDQLQIDGPAARVLMRGETDLKKETQRLNVSVQPELSSSAALGVAVINPLAGMAALLANKFLQNPLNKMFSFEYLVTGKWDDPKVERITATPTPAPPANSTQ
ncbi:YhdP family protein [Candidatus Accumulibacter sp. ACC005]|uniref:YhdP family protein n=1 Tax=Candidatus Accumulibacter sp. ACC005 TaxID=2823331 RepID=UPI0025BF8174|nr:YhdP family protein [Candidatus Accumulibacter sp. ACC005]